MIARSFRAVAFGVVLAGAAAGGADAAVAQATGTPARDASMRTLAGRLDLPLVEEAVATFSAQLRRTLPGLFVDTMGQGMVLGPRWKRGNRYFDEALRRVDAGLAAEEARGGPLLRLDRSDLLAAIRAPWSQADIAFLTDTAGTELGREAQRAIDAKVALQTTRSLVRRIGAQPGLEASAKKTAAAFADLEARAESQYGDASLMLVALRGTDPVRAKRLQALLEQVDTTPSDALGQRLADRLSQRLLEAAAMQLPDLLTIAADFRVNNP